MHVGCAWRLVWIVLALARPVPLMAQPAATATAPRTLDISADVAAAAQRFGLPEAWIYAVIRTESAGRVSAVSRAGAMGLMQLMPGTWARQRARFALGHDPFDPRDNILAGTSYLREMYDLFGSPGFLAAYNAGPGRYAEWRDRGRPLPAETRAYVTRIAALLQLSGTDGFAAVAAPVQPVRTMAAQDTLFVARSGASASDEQPGSGEDGAALPSGYRSPSGSLFAPVSASQTP